MRFERHPLVIFLDENPSKSAEYLSDRFLEPVLKNCCQVLVCSLMYNVGIRSSKICKYLFSKERKSESLERYFPGWPISSPPSFVKYTSEESKWCRKCKNHYDVVVSYFESLLGEYGYRTGREHELYDMLDFLRMFPYQMPIVLGVSMPYVKDMKITLPWKNLPLRYRKRDVLEGYRRYYRSLIYNPYEEYAMTKRDIPEFVLRGRNIDEFDPTTEN